MNKKKITSKEIISSYIHLSQRENDYTQDGIREYDALVLVAIIAICAVFWFMMWVGAMLREFAPHLLS